MSGATGGVARFWRRPGTGRGLQEPGGRRRRRSRAATRPCVWWAGWSVGRRCVGEAASWVVLELAGDGCGGRRGRGGRGGGPPHHQALSVPPPQGQASRCLPGRNCTVWDAAENGFTCGRRGRRAGGGTRLVGAPDDRRWRAMDGEWRSGMPTDAGTRRTGAHTCQWGTWGPRALLWVWVSRARIWDRGRAHSPGRGPRRAPQTAASARSRTSGRNPCVGPGFTESWLARRSPRVISAPARRTEE